MFSLRELKQANEAAAAKELSELRRDVARGLRHSYRIAGSAGVLRLLTEALGEERAREVGMSARMVGPENPVREGRVLR